MEIEHNARGFAYIKFDDRNGRKCRLQKSSLATQDAIWFGIVDPNPQIMVSDAKKMGLPFEGDSGWCKFSIPEQVSIDTDMHLTRDQVLALLPYLIQFVETGDIGNVTP
jgi:hypothetical protein